MENQTKATDNYEITEISNKKFCTKCGTELNSEAVICPSCCAEQKDVAESQDDKKIINKIKKHKKLLIICSGVLIVIIGIIVAVSIISYRSSLEYIAKTVKDEYPWAHYEVSYTGMSVTIDTNPDDETARRGMLVASTLGGMTIRFKSTGVPHLCSFSWFGRIAHGEAVAVLLPEAWKYYLANPKVAERTMELAEIFPGTTPEEVIESFQKFTSSIGLPQKLSNWQEITPELLEKTARSGAENKMKLENAPQPIPLEKSYEILLDIMKKSR